MSRENIHNIPEIDWKRTDLLIALALEEDLDEAGDTTTLAVVPANAVSRAVLRCKQEGMVVSGLAVAERVFKTVEPALQFNAFVKDGDVCKYGDLLAEISGPARGILTAERTALNFIQRLCGVATASRLYADALKDYNTVVLDTRKTTPGVRNLEKYSVAVGGATNHRIGLFDRIMIKDNHRELAAAEGDGAITRAVERARRAYPDLEIEVEADSLEEVREAAETGAEYIMLDNMDDATMAEAVKIVNGRAKLEASGGITLERLARIGKTGVDYVSSGALTHSVKSADISLDIEVVQQ
ncbi:MAG: carboxylating nicotinate-nucleotide diphosphorylase [Lentisphaeria bacterium]|nr:carboxylating nicotinate-nucleotide diphosphorylase [Lentisphaeria bacterium]